MHSNNQLPYLVPSDSITAKKVFIPFIEYCLKKGSSVEKKKRKYEKQQ